MKYVSTRGHAANQSFTDILLEGLAPDGGLSVPEQWPRVMPVKLEAMRDLPYPRLAFEIVRFFADDFPGAALKSACEKTYTKEIFGSPEITPLRTLEPNLHILGLSNGPTLAFKDIALQLIGNLFEHELAAQDRNLNVVGATSGDTGSAAEHALKGKPRVNVFMLSPQGRMSPFQRAQMFSLQEANIHNIAVEGVFDECQDVVKAINADAGFKEEHAIGAVNSINWARVVAQVVYYFKGYFAATSSNDEQVSFAVPSGNFGNIFAGYVAKKMGLPIRRLVLATNENDVLDEFFRTGRYRPRKAAETQETSSPSMDISKASNFERFIWDIVDGDGDKVAWLWEQVAQKGGFDLSTDRAWEKVEEDSGFVSGRSLHEDRVETIRLVKKKYNQVIDPHTADGVKVALRQREPRYPMICLETALPVKFDATIVEALGEHAPRPPQFEGLEKLPQRFTTMKPDPEALKDYIRSNH
ncbi:threonine synthase [Usitatibacter palustris]|uniref:Threonine synthase n=1 Tax=Usitatibacter palustris TaxID=2732487 RepID=A0A6M4H708_9PROT|nr:threonine synthase [Usitatibacter palustris]QJR15386.1 Threonine synthase [Usitatibacter palustris]